MRFDCIHCGQRLEADDDMRNVEIRCPYCTREITVLPDVTPDLNDNAEAYLCKEPAGEDLNVARHFPPPLPHQYPPPASGSNRSADKVLSARIFSVLLYAEDCY